MQKYFVIVSLLFANLQTVAILEQLPNESLIKKLYEEQTAQTTNTALLKSLQILNDGIQKLVDYKHDYEVVKIHDKNLDMSKEKKKVDTIVEQHIFYPFMTAIILYVHDKNKDAHTPPNEEVDALLTQEQTFLAELIDDVLQNSRQKK